MISVSGGINYIYSGGTANTYKIPLSLLEPGKTYTVSVVAKEDGKVDSPPSNTVTFTVIQGTGGYPKPAGEGKGLLAQYYDNMDFTTLMMSVFQKVSVKSVPSEYECEADTFSIRWTGLLVPKYSETYTFYTDTDDGVRLWVNNQLLIDQWNDKGGEYSGSISLNAEYAYEIKMEYYNNSNSDGTVYAKLMWSSDSQNKEEIPVSQLYGTGKGTGLGYCALCEYRFTQLSNPTDKYGYAAVWNYDFDSSLVTIAQEKFKSLGFNAGEGKNKDYERVILCSNIIIFQYKMNKEITGRLNQTLINQLQEAIDAGENYESICARTVSKPTKQSYPILSWNGITPEYPNSYLAFMNTSSSIVDIKGQTIRNHVDDFVVLPSCGSSYIPGKFAVAPKLTAVKWAELVQAAAVAVVKNSDGSDKLDANNNKIPLNLDLKCFLVTANDTAFRTFISTEYYWHKRQAHGGDLAAAPGSSNHCNGIAIDYNINWNDSNRNPKSGSMVTKEGIWLEWYGHIEDPITGLHRMKGNKEKYNADTGIWTYGETWHWEFN